MEQLREAYERFRLLADTAPVMLWMAGPDKRCLYFNHAWEQFAGLADAADADDDWLTRVHRDDFERCRAGYDRSFERREAFTMEYRLRRHDGEYRWVVHSGVPRFAADGTFSGFIGSALDITAHKDAERALAGFSHNLVQAHEAERTRIARELHDDIGQRMAVVRMELDGLSQTPRSGPADLQVAILSVSDRVLEIARDVQAIARRLHSPKLEYLGIASAAAGFCRELAAQTSADIRFSADAIPAHVPHDVALCLFRVLQEALTNAVKHAGGGPVTVALRGVGDQLHLEVADTGVGFDPAAAMRGSGLGLTTMRERLVLAGGEMAIDARPGRGTIVRARVPLNRPDDPAAARPA